MTWLEKLKGDPLPWLLEEDAKNPGVRYFALRELEGKRKDDPEVVAAQKAVMQSGAVPAILDAQEEGYWVKAGAGYAPKYTGTVWQIIFLAQFGADSRDGRVKAGCEYVLDNSRADTGGFSAGANRSGLIHCLQGNLAAALIDLGWWGDERLAEAVDWLARSITGEGIAPSEEKDAPVRYLRSANSAPGFVCSANNQLPCAWGAVKAMLALSKVPEEGRTASVKAAIERGVEFLFSRDPAEADYPMGFSEKPSRSWFQFGYPIAYVTDVLQNLEVLTALGYGGDPRLEPALEFLVSKQDEQGAGKWNIPTTARPGLTWRKRSSPANG